MQRFFPPLFIKSDRIQSHEVGNFPEDLRVSRNDPESF